MTDSLTVPTHFGDLSELSAGLADRVDEERIILYGPEAFEEGSMVAFAVLLVDGTPAIEGVGRVAASVDGGEARAPETRYDIVFDSLQLAGRSEVVYERIVLHRQSLMGDEPATGEIDLAEIEEAESFAAAEQGFVAAPDEKGDAAAYEEVDEDVVSFAASEAPPAAEAYEEVGEDVVSFAAFEAPPPPDTSSYDGSVPDEYAAAEAGTGGQHEAFEIGEDANAAIVGDGFGGDDSTEGATVVASLEELERAASAPPAQPPPKLPEAPEGFALPPLPAGLTRPVHPPTWWPSDAPPPQPRASSGWFQYGGELPIPSEPPRPDLDPALRVTPAPRPGAEATPNMPPREEPAPAGDVTDFATEATYGEEAASEIGFAESAASFDEAAPIANEDASPLDETVEAPLDGVLEVGVPDGDFEIGFGTGELDDGTVVPNDEEATAHEVSLPEGGPLEEP